MESISQTSFQEIGLPEASLRDALTALDALPQSFGASLPILDSKTGHVVAVLARPEAIALPEPPRLGGMATPLGVYLHDGVSSGGVGFWGLFLTGVTMSSLALTASALAYGMVRLADSHLPGLANWEATLPLGLRVWLSAISSWLPLPFVFLLLRLVPMSGTHAAEHQVVHCIERRAPLVLDCVRGMPRVHPRCGTNLFVGFTLFLLTFLAVFCPAQAEGWQAADAASLAAMLAVPLTLLTWRRVGGWVQQWLATRPATDAQIAGAIRAAEEVLSRRAARLHNGHPLRFEPLRRVWSMGLAQILLGYTVVIGLVTAVELIWPGAQTWLGM